MGKIPYRCILSNIEINTSDKNIPRKWTGMTAVKKNRNKLYFCQQSTLPAYIHVSPLITYVGSDNVISMLK